MAGAGNSDKPENLDHTVAVIGGGLAGITAAVKLFRQGYTVTLFEKAPMLGGNLSSYAKNNAGGYCDVYPHIIGDWYKEFWYLLKKDLGLVQEDIFAERDRIKMAMIPADATKLKNFTDVQFAEMATPTSLGNLLCDLDSGIMPKLDMFLFGYTYLDLVSVPRAGKQLKVMDELDVTGYLASRPYMNNKIAELHDDILKIIWSMPSDSTSAQAYQDLIRHTLTFPNETPFAWLVKGPAEKKLMGPIKNALEAAFKKVFEEALKKALEEPGGKPVGKSSLRLGIAIEEIHNEAENNLVRLSYKITEDAPEESKENIPTKFRYVVVATQASAALQLAFSPADGKNLVKSVPKLARLREAEIGRIPVVYVYFSEQFLQRQGGALKDLPEELIGFKQEKPSTNSNGKPSGNDYDISILDIEKLWDRDAWDKDASDERGLKKPTKGEPVLVLAASHATAIQARGPKDFPHVGTAADEGTAQGFEMIRKLSEYLPFIQVKPGDKWDQCADIDWKRTRVITNEEHQLFLNDTDSNSWRPSASMLGLNNVFFAGDYCLTDVNMATVEAAVQSGVLAAQAIQKKDGFGKPIYLQPHDNYGANPLLLVKLLSAPLAYAAALAEIYKESAHDPIQAMTFPHSVAVVTTAYWADWLRSALDFGRGCLPQNDVSPSGSPATEDVADHDNRIGIAQLALNVGLALATEGPGLVPNLQDTATEALYSAWYWTVGKRIFPDIRRTFKDPTSKAAPTYAPPAPAGKAPSTWSGLLLNALGTEKVTPKVITSSAFGAAATLVEAIQISDKGPPENAKDRTLSMILNKAKPAGKLAREAYVAGYLEYDTMRDIVPKALTAPAVQNAK
jgi:hypothetical protein